MLGLINKKIIVISLQSTKPAKETHGESSGRTGEAAEKVP